MQRRRLCTSQRGLFSFAKENTPFETPRERLDIAGEQLEELQCLPIAPLACGKAAFTPAIRLGVLLSSAAALPISRWYSLISVYRSTSQCGERSNAAISHAVCRRCERHSRLTIVRRGCERQRLAEASWRSHVHRTHTAQRVQSFKNKTHNVGGRGGLPSSFLLGV